MFCHICKKCALSQQQGRKVMLLQTPRRSFASSLDIPLPRLKEPSPTKTNTRFIDALHRHVRVAPWGPRPEGSLASLQPLPSYAQLETVPVPATNILQKGQMAVSSDHFQRVGRKLQQYGMESAEIEENPGIFTLPLLEIENALEVFKECGWEIFTTDMIFYSTGLVAKIAAKDLINSENFSVVRKVLKNLLTELEIAESLQEETLKIVTETSAVFLTLSDLRILAMRDYLRTIFCDPADIQKVFKLIMKSSEPPRPVKNVQQQFRFLTKEFLISAEKILRYPKILAKTSQNFDELLKNYSVFYGLDMRVIASHNPHVLLPSVERFSKLEKVLKKFKITSFQFSRQLNIVNLAAETVELRLKAIQNEELLTRYHDEADFLSLVHLYGEIMRRLSFLKTMKVKDFPLQLLICSRPRFHETLGRFTFRKDDEIQIKPQNLMPVSAFLKMPPLKIRKLMRDQLQDNLPPYVAASTKDMQRIVDCLKTHRISQEQLLNCLSICMYPANIVEKYMAQVMQDSSLTTKKKQANFLHYVLYQIEKQTSFGGAKAWGAVRDSSPDSSPNESGDSSPNEFEGTDNVTQLKGVRSVIRQNVAAKLAEVDEISANVPPVESSNDQKKEEWFD